MTVSEKIFELLEAKGMSQRELAEKTGISKSTVNDWKTKKNSPAADKIPAVRAALEVSYEELFDDSPLEPEKMYYISKDDELAFIVEEYRKMNKATAKRVMAYMKAIFETEKRI